MKESRSSLAGRLWSWMGLVPPVSGSPDEPDSEVRLPPPTPPGLRHLHPPPFPSTGGVLGSRYRLGEELGRGAGAVVFVAVDTELDQEVAVKVLRPGGLYELDGARALGASLRAEARAAMRLSHPNIVRVYTYERDQGWEYLVMERVKGPDLGRVRKERPGHRLPLDEVQRVALACLDALAYAHGVGLVHHDLKPANILVAADGTVKLCDLGLARPPGGAGAGDVLAGSPLYMSPERIRGGMGGPPSDLYSLAATVYTLLTGSPPFGGRSEVALRGHLVQTLAPAAEVPPALFRVLARAMEKDVHARYETAAEMRSELVRAIDQDRAALARPAEVVVPETASRQVAIRRAAERARWVPAPRPRVEDEGSGVGEPIPTEEASGVEPAVPAAASEPAAPIPNDPLTEPAVPAAVPNTAPAVTAPAVTAPADTAPAVADTAVAVTDTAPAVTAAVQDPAPVIAPPPPPVGMAWITPRTVIVGRQTLTIDGFFLDRHPVTNAEWREFVLATGEIPPAHWFGTTPPAGREDHPAVGMSVGQARRYAAWRRRRLPTQAEWMAVAAGVHTFPWGDACRPEHCQCARSGATSTAAVGAHAGGASPEGCGDLVGNVWEWVEPDPRLPAPDPGTAWALGGSFLHPCRDAKVPMTSVGESSSFLYLGFRCAADAPREE